MSIMFQTVSHEQQIYIQNSHTTSPLYSASSYKSKICHDQEQQLDTGVVWNAFTAEASLNWESWKKS